MIFPFVCVGAIIGVLLDVLSGFIWLGRVHRWRRTDMLIGLLAAPITFGAALVWMDGQLHPLLFGGVAIGLFLEHWAVGKRLSRLLYHGALLIKRGLRHWLLMTQRRCEDTSKVEMLPVSEENL